MIGINRRAIVCRLVVKSKQPTAPPPNLTCRTAHVQHSVRAELLSLMPRRSTSALAEVTWTSWATTWRPCRPPLTP